ncbi:concanavalin A-like lectin/glucanase domain-containing protein [Delphinella strobiligena]|nr:concanavalin A-like lectin/glucanase domain-containing protein [Delphinella strobiligena]
MISSSCFYRYTTSYLYINMKYIKSSIPHITVLASLALPSVAQSCNPVVNTCTPNSGLDTSTCSIDFTKQTTIPSGWTISNYANVPFGPQGAEFTFAKRYDAPQLWTDFYILFGKVETVMQVAPGQGIVSSAVLMSDDLDEIDWDLAKTTSTCPLLDWARITTTVRFFNVASPQSQFHTYTTDWTPTQLTWSVDGVVAKGSDYQYPQSPSKFQLGIWDVSWAGGYTDLTKGMSTSSHAPFTMYVKSVGITNANPAYAYNYTDRSGSWGSIQLLNRTITSISSTSTISSTTAASVSSSVIPNLSSSLSSLAQKLTGTTTTTSVTTPSTTSVPISQATSAGPISVSTSSVTKLSPTITTSSSTHTTTSQTPCHIAVHGIRHPVADWSQ